MKEREGERGRGDREGRERYFKVHNRKKLSKSETNVEEKKKSIAFIQIFIFNIISSTMHLISVEY